MEFLTSATLTVMAMGLPTFAIFLTALLTAMEMGSLIAVTLQVEHLIVTAMERPIAAILPVARLIVIATGSLMFVISPVDHRIVMAMGYPMDAIWRQELLIVTPTESPMRVTWSVVLPMVHLLPMVVRIWRMRL